MRRAEVTVIGAAGHVGLGMSLALTHAGYCVNGVDISVERNRMIMSGVLPFNEECAQELLDEAIERGRIRMTTEISRVKASKFIIHDDDELRGFNP